MVPKKCEHMVPKKSEVEPNAFSTFFVLYANHSFSRNRLICVCTVEWWMLMMHHILRLHFLLSLEHICKCLHYFFLSFSARKDYERKWMDHSLTTLTTVNWSNASRKIGLHCPLRVLLSLFSTSSPFTHLPHPGCPSSIPSSLMISPISANHFHHIRCVISHSRHIHRYWWW